MDVETLQTARVAAAAAALIRRSIFGTGIRPIRAPTRTHPKMAVRLLRINLSELKRLLKPDVEAHVGR